MDLAILYSVASVLIVSLIALIGIFMLSIQADKLKRILIYLISFSAGALFGDAFLHLLPEVVEDNGMVLGYSFSILGGILVFFSLEKVIHWRHCHMPIGKEHVHPFAYTNLIGDSLHNFIDGLIIVASYLVSIPAGVATTIAVLLHEIPQEIGDFGVMVYAGFSKFKALMLNFITALTSVLGVFVGLYLDKIFVSAEAYLVCFAIGGFLYIA